MIHVFDKVHLTFPQKSTMTVTQPATTGHPMEHPNRGTVAFTKQNQTTVAGRNPANQLRRRIYDDLRRVFTTFFYTCGNTCHVVHDL